MSTNHRARSGCDSSGATLTRAPSSPLLEVRSDRVDDQLAAPRHRSTAPLNFASDSSIRGIAAAPGPAAPPFAAASISAQSFAPVYGRHGTADDPTIARTGFFAGSRYTNIPAPDASPLDMRIALKARFLRKKGFGMAAIAAVTLPFGDEAAFLGDSWFTFRPRLVADYTWGPVTVALNLGAIVRETTRVLDRATVGPARVHAAPDHRAHVGGDRGADLHPRGEPHPDGRVPAAGPVIPLWTSP